VGKKKPNDWGLYDMHGNVWEWCQDWYDSSSYAKSSAGGPATGSLRVVRGGGWDAPAWNCRSASRANFKPGDRDGDLGLRVALVPAE
jgi:formylglycine-generating enzyme required for sulfatase activity